MNLRSSRSLWHTLKRAWHRVLFLTSPVLFVRMVNPPNDKIVFLYQPRGSKGHGLLHCALGGLSLLPEARHEHTSLTCGHEAQAGVITEALPRS